MGDRERYLAVAVVCLFLFASLAGCIDDNPEIEDEPSREIQFGEIDIYPIDLQGERSWVVEMVITDVDFEGIDEVRWEDMEWAFHKDGGVVGGVGISGSQGPFPDETGWWFIPVEPGSEIVSVGDRLIFYGLSEWQMEADFSLRWAFEMTMDRPTVFEMVLGDLTPPVISVSMSDPVLDSIIFPGSTSYTYEAEVTDIDPSNASLNWWTLQLRIESPTGEFGDFFGPLIEDPGLDGYDGENGPPDIEFWYIDDPLGGTNGSGTPTGMDVGDSVKITGLSETFEGGIVSLRKGNDTIWTSDPIPEMPEPNMVLELGTPSIYHIERNGTALWNISIPISDVNPEDLIQWDSIWVRIWDAEEVVKRDSELYGQDPANFSDRISVYWDDFGPQDEVISIGDNIVIKGLNLTFQGGLVEVYRQFTLLDSIRLPIKWPIPDIEIITYNASMIIRTEGLRVFVDAMINISNIIPMNVPFHWEDLEARVIDKYVNRSLVPLDTIDVLPEDLPDRPDIFSYLSPDPVPGEFLGYFYAACLYSSFEDTWFEVYLNGSIVCEVQLFRPFNPEPTEMVIASPSVNYYEFSNHTEYRIILIINKITPADVILYWTNITLEVENSTGAVLIAESHVQQDPGIYDEDPSDGIDIGLWYVEVTTGGYTASAGDALKLTGISKDAEGGSVNIYSDGVLIGAVRLPTNFP
jgi:hypothetical protein